MNLQTKQTGCLIYIGLALLIAASAGFFALTLAGAIGGTVMGVAPQWSFTLVKPIICPGEAQLQFYSVERSYHRPGESEPHLECLTLEGESKNVLLPGIFAVLGGSFLLLFSATFVVLYLPLAVLVGILWRRIRSDDSSRPG